jgi:hypothetical protein
MTISKIRESDFKFINGFIQNENLFLNSSNLITFTVVGLILYGINVIWIWNDKRRIQKKLKDKEHEVMALKAQLFDLSPSTPSVPPATEANQEDTQPEE